MLSWIIQITIISIILVFLVNHLIHFFKSTLTVPKIKDLVNTPKQKYENMYNIIQQNSLPHTNDEYTLIDLLPKKEDTTMKNELKNFLKKQLNGSSNNVEPDISGLDSTSNVNFSFYKK
jgi:hypothetical protein